MLLCRGFMRVASTAKCCYNGARSSSALYITGDKAHEHYAVLKPHIDIVERFKDKTALEENIKARGKYVDLEGIANRWAFYQNLYEKKVILEAIRNEISKEISRLMKAGDNEENKSAITKLKTQINIVKDEYSTLKNFMYGVEESAALKALSLPNVLHERTPTTAPQVLIENLTKPQPQIAEDFPSHIKIGNENELLEVHDSVFAFLTNDAALYELAVLWYFQDKLTQSGLTQFSCPDFAKSIVIEGCGSDFENKTDVITIADGSDHYINRLHLTGGASHYAFMAHFTRYVVLPTQFPLGYFAIGRKYQPIFKDDPTSLFNLAQQSAIEIFTATKSHDEMNKSLDSLINNIADIYKGLGYHFKMSIVKADQLKNYESLRVAIEMYSNHLEDYVEIGSISVVDAFISKRLLFTYTENKEMKFPKVIVGNVLNVQKMLACVLENNWENGRLKSILCEVLQPHLP